MMFSIRRGAVAAGVLTLIAGASAGSATSATAPTEGGGHQTAPDVVTIRVAPLSPSPLATAPVWVAHGLGFFEEEGLDVEMIGNVPGGSVETALAAGQLDIGGSAHSNLFPRAATLSETGDDIQIFLPDSRYPWHIMVLEESTVETQADLAGARIGITEPGGDETTTQLLMSIGGVDVGEYETIVTGGRAAGGVALSNGDVDAFQGSYVDRAAIEGAGIPVRIVGDGTEDSFFLGGWAARRDFIDEHPDVIERFGRAWVRGAIWAWENPNVAIDVIEDVAPEAVTDRDAASGVLMLANENNRALYEQRFAFDLEGIQSLADALFDIGALDEPLETSSIVRTEFAEAIWDFDVEAETAAAQAGEH